MADDSVLILIVALIFPVLIVPVSLWVRKFIYRNHVWADLDLKEGRTTRRLVRPENGSLFIGNAEYKAAGKFVMYKSRPLYRFAQGQFRPIVYGTTYVQNPANGKLTPVVNPEIVQVSGEMLATAGRSKIFSQIYGGGQTLQLLVVGLLVLVLLAVVVLAARGGM